MSTLKNALGNMMAETSAKIADRERFLLDVAAGKHLSEETRAELKERTEQEIKNLRESFDELTRLFEEAQ